MPIIGFLIITAFTVGLTLLIMRILGIPLYSSDPFGKKSKILLNLFGLSKRFRQRSIDKAANLGIFKAMIVAGEFGNGIQESVRYSLEKGMDVEIIGGPVENLDPESKIALDDLYKEYPQKISYYALNERPIYHFSIFGEDLFIEKKHTPEAKIKGSVGVIDAYPEFHAKFAAKFSEMRKLGTMYEN